MVPKIIHFITGLAPDFGGKPFTLVHAMAVRSARMLNPDFRIRLYYCHEPSGVFWNMIRDEVELVRVESPAEVFGRPLSHFAHKADVLRLQLLIEQGGIYLDLDTICVRPFEPLLDSTLPVMAPEVLADGQRKGLCNATILSPPGSKFLQIWYESYREFSDEVYEEFGILVPDRLAKQHPDLVRILPHRTFFPFCWDPQGQKDLFENVVSLDGVHCIHLWEKKTWKRLVVLDPDTVRRVDTTYNLLARHYLGDFTAGKANSEQPSAPIPRGPTAVSAALRTPFEQIYARNAWGSGSGIGSHPVHNIEYTAFLSRFMRDNGIRSVVDFGCGDWQFSRYVNWSGIEYTGLDVVPSVIERNRAEFAAPGIRFELLDDVKTAPPADLVLCKDVLQHLPNAVAQDYLVAFQSNYRFALVTNDEEPPVRLNEDIPPGGWRAIRLDLPPFSVNAAAVFSWHVLAPRNHHRKVTRLLMK